MQFIDITKFGKWTPIKLYFMGRWIQEVCREMRIPPDGVQTPVVVVVAMDGNPDWLLDEVEGACDDQGNEEPGDRKIRLMWTS